MAKKFNPQAIVLLRKLGNLSQSGLAKLLDVTSESIRNYEHGRSEPAGYVVDRIWREFIIPKKYHETIKLYDEE